MKMRARYLLPTTLCVCLLLTTAALAAQPEQKSPVTYDLDIPAERLNDALQALALALNRKLLYSSELTEGKDSAALRGKFTADEALKRLLSGSKLTYEITSDGLLLIRAAVAIAPVTSKATDSGEASLASAARAGDDDDPPQPSGASTTQAAADEKARNLEEVVVTGSHIRGVHNDSTPMMTFDREYIDRSGYSNMMQLVESLPVDFSGGASGSSETAAFGNAANQGQNLTRGTGFNLHGLGSVATLTLINGRRIAPSGQGQFVDVSNIPLAAVERVEILTDGASAIYGADAVAGVVNIILRKNFDGAETSASYGQATRGGTSEERLSQTYGTHWASGDALVIGDLHVRDPLDGRNRDYIAQAGGAPPQGPTDLLPDRKAASLVFNLDQSLPAGFDLSTNILYSHEKVHQAQSFSDDTIFTEDPVTNQESGLVALGYKAFGDWRFELDGTISHLETVTDLTVREIPSGVFDRLTNDYRDRFATWEGALRGDGSLFPLPAGNVRLAIGASYRNDRVISTRENVVPPRGLQVRARDQRNIGSAYAELFVPFISKEQGVPGVRRIEMSVAGRYDNYSDFGSTSNPKIGLVWSPIDSLDLRATWGTSFRAPTVAEKALVTRGIEIGNTTVDSPAGGQVPAFFLMGSAPLSAEKSRDTAVGFTFRPEIFRNAELTFNYFDIDYRGRISTAPFEQDLLLHPSDFAGLITAIPSDAAAQAVLNSALAEGDLYVDFLGTGATGVRYLLDLRQQNAARTRTSGYDITGRYSLPLARSTLNFDLNLSHINKILTSVTSQATPIDEVNTYEQPLKTRVRGLSSWIVGGWNGSLILNYWNSYLNNSVTPHERIKAWTTVDMNFSYDFGISNPSSILRGCKASLTVTNLFDVNPPLTTDPLFAMGFDVFNGDALGRYVTARVVKQW